MIQAAPESASVDIDGPQVRRRRKLLGVNIAAFATRCGITEGYLSHIERGRRKTVSPKVFGQICEALGIEDQDRQQLVGNPSEVKA